MLLRIEQAGFGGRWGNRPKHVDVLRCDHCQHEYRIKHRTVNDTPLTFCSRSCVARSETVKLAKKQTCLKTYGVEYVSQVSSVKHSKHQTRKRNGTYGRSNVEDDFYVWLTSQYGIDHVERWPRINGWSIDFHVRSIEAWVQFDGVYWHGLMHAYKHLTEGQRKVYDKDRAQDEWFRVQGMKLVRVTDKELLACYANDDFTTIIAKVG